jgi:hypothetical protein
LLELQHDIKATSVGHNILLPTCQERLCASFVYREAIGGAYLQKCKDVFQMIDAVITEK